MADGHLVLKHCLFQLCGADSAVAVGISVQIVRDTIAIKVPGALGLITETVTIGIIIQIIGYAITVGIDIGGTVAVGIALILFGRGDTVAIIIGIDTVLLLFRIRVIVDASEIRARRASLSARSTADAPA